MVSRRWLLTGLLTSLPAIAHAVDTEGKYRSLPDELRNWFKGLKIPGRPSSTCCDIADGEEVWEDIRGESYWILSMKDTGKFKDWTEVPNAAVLKDTPNKYGLPLAWGRQHRTSYQPTGPIIVVCYLPGVGI